MIFLEIVIKNKQKPGFILLVAVFVGLLFCSAGQARETDISVPLYVINRTGAQMPSFPVNGGIPFPEGIVFPEDVSRFSIVDSQGSQIPAQFDPFVLWWGKDRSVKWLGIDMIPHGKDPGTSRYVLTTGNKQAAGKGLLQVFESEHDITVETGPLKAVVSKQRGTLLESVFVEGRQVIQPDIRNGIHITSENQKVVYGTTDGYNMWGTGSGRITNYEPKGRLAIHTYMSSLGPPEKVEIEANGPVRATILIQGRHLPQEKGPGIKPDGFYHYTVRLHFFAGKPFIKMEQSIDNNRQDYPIHIYRIKDLRLHFALANQAEKETKYLIGGENQTTSGTLDTHDVSIFQDSANLDRWNLYAGLQNKSKEERKATPGYFLRSGWKIGPALFRGYKIIDDNVLHPENTLLCSGDHAPGWAGIHDGHKGIFVHINHFWQQCPKGIVLGRSFIEPVLFPAFSPEDFQIHSGTRKSHTLYLNFMGSENKLQEIDRLSNLFVYPPLLKAEKSQYAESLALPRAIGINRIKGEMQSGHWYPHFKWDRKIITARWNTAGQSTGFNQGGMHDNYWPIFSEYLSSDDIFSYEKGMIHAKWASESIPWLIDDYSLTPDKTELQSLLIGWGEKKLFTSEASTQIKGWVTPYTTTIPGFSSPAKFYMDGEHLIHVWPFEWYYLTGSPLAKDGLTALGNQAKYSTHRNFFKSSSKYGGTLYSAPSLNHIFYFDDTLFPERVPWYFYTRIYATHLLSTAMTYGATGDESSLFYARWLVRRILYLQKQHGGVLSKKRRWRNISPWQESEAAIAAFELYKEIGDEELLDIMGSWLEWVWHETYSPGKGMPHRFKRGTPKEQLKKFEHHWYPGVAAPLCYAALGDPKALTLTKEWANTGLAYIKKGEFMDKPVGQSASYVLNYMEKFRQDKIPPENVSDLATAYDTSSQVLQLTWTAPADKGTNSTGSAKKYWIKIAEQPIVDHPEFPDCLDTQTGFYQADNISQEPVPGTAGTQETFTISAVSPHGAYGAEKKIKISDFEKGTYYFALKSWDKAGNLSDLSNITQVEIR